MSDPTNVNLRVKATAKPQCANPCPSGELSGKNAVKLKVNPYVIYERTARLPQKEVEELANWGADKGLFTPVVSATKGSVLFALGVLEGAEVAAETAVKALAAAEAAEPIVAVGEFLHLAAEDEDRLGYIAMLLNALNVSPIGIGDPPFEAQVEGGLSDTFEYDLASFGSVAGPFKLNASGALWDFAHTLGEYAQHEDTRSALDDTSIKLKIYEVSHCDPIDGNDYQCGPGYGNEVGSDQVLNPGIQPELYFQLQWTFGHLGAYISDFTIPYDAIAWDETQPEFGGLLGVK
ncbi:MAG: hypothetical protein ACLP01_33155 [Solirubrobacteraceae bacterium]